MVQVAVYLKGERDYSKISGPTGPLVYVSVTCVRKAELTDRHMKLSSRPPLYSPISLQNYRCGTKPVASTTNLCDIILDDIVPFMRHISSSRRSELAFGFSPTEQAPPFNLRLEALQ